MAKGEKRGGKGRDDVASGAASPVGGSSAAVAPASASASAPAPAPAPAPASSLAPASAAAAGASTVKVLVEDASHGEGDAAEGRGVREGGGEKLLSNKRMMERRAAERGIDLRVADGAGRGATATQGKRKTVAQLKAEIVAHDVLHGVQGEGIVRQRGRRTREGASKEGRGEDGEKRKGSGGRLAGVGAGAGTRGGEVKTLKRRRVGSRWTAQQHETMTITFKTKVDKFLDHKAPAPHGLLHNLHDYPDGSFQEPVNRTCALCNQKKYKGESKSVGRPHTWCPGCPARLCAGCWWEWHYGGKMPLEALRERFSDMRRSSLGAGEDGADD